MCIVVQCTLCMYNVQCTSYMIYNVQCTLYMHIITLYPIYISITSNSDVLLVIVWLCTCVNTCTITLISQTTSYVRLFEYTTEEFTLYTVTYISECIVYKYMNTLYTYYTIHTILYIYISTVYHNTDHMLYAVV